MRCKYYDETYSRCFGQKSAPGVKCEGNLIDCEKDFEFEFDKPASKPDMVNHPAHYTAGGIECIDALKAATVSLEGIEAVCTANAIKYLWRWKNKNGVEDLKKSIWYINRLIEELDNSN